MKIIITEEQKNKLFIPRKLSDNDSRYSEWNNSQPIKNGVQINQYDIEGNKTGLWEEYYEYGNICFKGSYVNGKKEGEWEHYFSNGQLYSKGSYKNGYLNGKWETYFDNGDLNTKGSYINDKKNGIWRFYHDGNRLYHKRKYKNNIIIGSTPINESEEPKKKLFIPRKLSDDDSRYSDWNNKQPVIDGKRINQYDSEGRKQGYWERPYDNHLPEKKLTIKGVFNNGVRDGWWSITYPNGKVYLKSFFKDGKAIY